MGMVGIFCTHSINILAGCNGVEVAQSLVIAISIMFHCLFGLCREEGVAYRHHFTLYFILPFIGVSYALYLRNK
jgi:UDP-N-acetylglucosamine--dolichyl-phosphate N-acetylglucosaminephosphotransferase